MRHSSLASTTVSQVFLADVFQLANWRRRTNDFSVCICIARARAKNTANNACATLFFTQRNPLTQLYSGKRMHCYLCTATVKSNRFIEVSSPFICYPYSLSHCIIVGLITGGLEPLRTSDGSVERCTELP